MSTTRQFTHSRGEKRQIIHPPGTRKFARPPGTTRRARRKHPGSSYDKGAPGWLGGSLKCATSLRFTCTGRRATARESEHPFRLIANGRQLQLPDRPTPPRFSPLGSGIRRGRKSRRGRPSLPARDSPHVGLLYPTILPDRQKGINERRYLTDEAGYLPPPVLGQAHA